MPPRRRLMSVRLLAAASMFAVPVLVAPGAGAAPVLPAAGVKAKVAAEPAAVVTTARGRSAVRWANRHSRWPERRCIVFVRTALHIGVRYPTPRIAWAHAHHRHRTRFSAIPAGVPVFTAGRSSPGHIVLSLGHGWVRSTDWPHPGHVGTVRLARLLHTWHHRYLGWSEDLNGVRVWHR